MLDPARDLEHVEHFCRADGSAIVRRTNCDTGQVRHYGIVLRDLLLGGTSVGTEAKEFEILDEFGSPVVDTRLAAEAYDRCSAAAVRRLTASSEAHWRS